MITGKLQHYSASQITTYLRCPLVYYFRYIKNLKRPASGHMHLGTAFHKANEVNYKQKIESKKDLELSVVKDAYGEAWDKPREEIDYQDENPAELKDAGYGLVEVYYNEAATKTQPVYVEQGASLQVPELDREILLYIDLVDDKQIIRDSKTTSKAPAEDEAKKSLQLSIYAMGYRALTGKKEKGLGLDYAVKTKTPKFIPLREPARTDWELERDLKDIREVARCIAAGLFPPCAPGYWLCSRKWCGYFDICRERPTK